MITAKAPGLSVSPRTNPLAGLHLKGSVVLPKRFATQNEIGDVWRNAVAFARNANGRVFLTGVVTNGRFDMWAPKDVSIGDISPVNELEVVLRSQKNGDAQGLRTLLGFSERGFASLSGGTTEGDGTLVINQVTTAVAATYRNLGGFDSLKDAAPKWMGSCAMGAIAVARINLPMNWTFSTDRLPASSEGSGTYGAKLIEYLPPDSLRVGDFSAVQLSVAAECVDQLLAEDLDPLSGEQWPKLQDALNRPENSPNFAAFAESIKNSIVSEQGSATLRSQSWGNYAQSTVAAQLITDVAGVGDAGTMWTATIDGKGEWAMELPAGAPLLIFSPSGGVHVVEGLKGGGEFNADDFFLPH